MMTVPANHKAVMLIMPQMLLDQLRQRGDVSGLSVNDLALVYLDHYVKNYTVRSEAITVKAFNW